MIDSKKTWAIKNWMEKCCQEAKSVVMDSMQDSPFQYGPWGEQLAQMSHLFMGSVAEGFKPLPTCSLAPLANEESLQIDWDLRLDAAGQAMLFKRIKIAFDMNTAIVTEIREKRRYRMATEELIALRNLCALWQQLRPFCLSRVPDFEAFEGKLLNGSALDEQFEPLLQECPTSFAVSMLPMSQRAAMSELKQKEESVTVEVEKQRLELRSAKWKWFQGALARDQSQMALVSAAPEKLQALRHRKEMAWRLEQAKVGERIVIAYGEKYLRCRQLQQLQHLHEAMHEYRNFVVPCFFTNMFLLLGLGLHVLLLVDLNLG